MYLFFVNYVLISVGDNRHSEYRYMEDVQCACTPIDPANFQYEKFENPLQPGS